MTYEMVFTPLAMAFAEAHGGLKALEEQARAEIAELDCAPADIFFHVVTFNGNDYLVRPQDGRMLVDTATYEESKPLESGPFKGKALGLPSGDSDE